jgi:DNA-binding MarR family transcriptional regulator
MNDRCTVAGCPNPRFATTSRCHRHTPPDAQTIRAVWLLVTRWPHASHQELAAQLQCSTSTVGRALWALHDAGYITLDPARHYARRVLVGYGVTRGGVAL